MTGRDGQRLTLSRLFRVYKASYTLACLILIQLCESVIQLINPMVEMRGRELEKDLMNDVTLHHEAGIKKKKKSLQADSILFQL